MAFKKTIGIWSKKFLLCKNLPLLLRGFFAQLLHLGVIFFLTFSSFVSLTFSNQVPLKKEPFVTSFTQKPWEKIFSEYFLLQAPYIKSLQATLGVRRKVKKRLKKNSVQLQQIHKTPCAKKQPAVSRSFFMYRQRENTLTFRVPFSLELPISINFAPIVKGKTSQLPHVLATPIENLNVLQKPLTLEEAIEKAFLSQKDADELYDVLELTDKVLREKKIPYALYAGGLLGYMRNGGPLPWDDDLDLAIPFEYENALMQAKEAFEEVGLHFWSLPDLKVFKVCKSPPQPKAVFIDLFIFKEYPGEGIWHYAAPICRNDFFPKSYFNKNPFEDLRTIKFGDLPNIFCVDEENGRDWLSRAYPGDWEKEVVIYNHRLNQSARFPLSIDERLQNYIKRSPK